MSDECYNPPSLSFEPAVLGPLTAREALVVAIFLIVSIPVMRISAVAAAAVMPFATALGIFVVAEGRRGKHPLLHSLYFLQYRLGQKGQAAYGNAGETVLLPPARLYRLDGVSFSCALRAVRETVISSCVGLCSSAEGYIRFISLPIALRDGLQAESTCSVPDVLSLEQMRGIRLFYLQLSGDQPFDQSVGTASAVELTGDCCLPSWPQLSSSSEGVWSDC